MSDAKFSQQIFAHTHTKYVLFLGQDMTFRMKNGLNYNRQACLSSLTISLLVRRDDPSIETMHQMSVKTIRLSVDDHHIVRLDCMGLLTT